jgi:hypothetical protein
MTRGYKLPKYVVEIFFKIVKDFELFLMHSSYWNGKRGAGPAAESVLLKG